MQEITISLQILADILDEGVSFSDALKKKFQSNVALHSYRSDVAALVGCELRHHLMFMALLKDKDLDEEQKRIVALGLSNIAFSHRLDAKKVAEDVKDSLGDKYPLYEELAVAAEKPEQLIPSSIARSSNQYLSLRYNTPEWALKIFEHFGYGNTYKILRKVNRPVTPTLRVRTSVLPIEELTSSLEFVASSTPDMVDYRGKTSLRKNPYFKEGKIFFEKPFAHNLLLNYRVSAPQQILLYNGNASSSFERDLIEMYGSSIGLNIAVDKIDDKPEVLRLLRDKELHNVNFFSAPNAESMASAVSTGQDLVIVAPNSTNFDDIPSSPDFLLSFNRDKMDGLLDGEKKALNNAAEFVEVGGLLLYVVFTMSKKEGHLLVAEFLREHEKFHLVEEKQHFPFEKEGVGAYVAVMQHGEKPLAATPPLLDIAESEMGSTFEAAAGAK